VTLTDERVRNGEYKLQPVATASALYSTYETIRKWLYMKSLIEAFEDRHKVFRMLLKEGLITEERIGLFVFYNVPL
jgi:hypothetical protein